MLQVMHANVEGGASVQETGFWYRKRILIQEKALGTGKGSSKIHSTFAPHRYSFGSLEYTFLCKKLV